MKIKVGDNVLVTTGKYRNKTGKVIRLYKKTSQVVVEKINIRTKHIKKTTTKAGERIQFEAPFNISNVKVICPQCSKAVRVGYIKPENAKKQRICKKCKEVIDQEVKAVKKK